MRDINKTLQRLKVHVHEIVIIAASASAAGAVQLTWLWCVACVMNHELHRKETNFDSNF